MSEITTNNVKEVREAIRQNAERTIKKREEYRESEDVEERITYKAIQRTKKDGKYQDLLDAIAEDLKDTPMYLTPEEIHAIAENMMYRNYEGEDPEVIPGIED